MSEKDKSRLMQMHLTEFEVDDVLGIYGADKNHLASRMRFLHPEAAASFKKMNEEHTVKLSDMFRTAEGSLTARRQKDGRGLRPGWSGHNYGFSIDTEYGWVQKNGGFATKDDMDRWMASHGWYCHNPYGVTRDFEAWHYNYFGDEAEKYLALRTNITRTWSKCVAGKIDDYYGKWWEDIDDETIQEALQSVGLYEGDIDGIVGPKTLAAIKEFQKKWDLDIDGKVGPMTGRTLMLVSSVKVLEVPEPEPEIILPKRKIKRPKELKRTPFYKFGRKKD